MRLAMIDDVGRMSGLWDVDLVCSNQGVLKMQH
jgi:hypothetical protein